MAKVKCRGTKTSAKRISLAQGMRLAATELTSGVRYNTSKAERRPDDAKPRRPKITVRVDDGKVFITTRRKQKPRPKRIFAFLESTAPLKTRWKPPMKNILRIQVVKKNEKPNQEPTPVATMQVPPRINDLRMRVQELRASRLPMSRVRNQIAS